MKKLNIKMIIILAAVCAGFFYTQNIKIALAEEKIVQINEIAWMGGEASADEWIELKNNSAFTIDLEGWSLTAQDGSPKIELKGSILADGYFLMERTDDDSVPNVQADLFYTGALVDAGEVLELRDADGNIIDLVDASGGWPAGDNENKLTMEKDADGNWHNSVYVGGTPRAGNSVIIVDEEDENKEQGVEPPIGDSTPIGGIVINEFVSDPADGEVEWIELYNRTSEKIDLIGWTIEEGSGAKTNLTGEIDKFFVIEKPKGNLNNAGDVIILRDGDGNLISQVVYGDWDDGNIENNAPAAGDPNSTARKVDGSDSVNNKNDFAVTAEPTKGASNIIKDGANSEESGEGKTEGGDIIISEILPDPFGVDADGEFIELHNAGKERINLLGWRIENEAKVKFEFKKEKIINAGEYLAIYRKESGLVLNNGGGSVKLFKPENSKAAQTVKFKKAKEGVSYNYNGEEWIWSDKPTPGRENILPEINSLPIVKIYCSEEADIGAPVLFDASDTFDADGDELKFFWDFGDGFKNNLQNPAHSFMQEGNYTVILTVSDGKDEATISKKVEVRSENFIKSENGDMGNKKVLNGIADKIIINEILPSPAGNDADEEWVELKNQGDDKVNLLNWTLDDAEGGSSPYVITNSNELETNLANFFINPGEYFVVSRIESKIALNNGGDFVRLFDDYENLIDEIEYGQAAIGESYARGEDGKWFWTNILTPGEENIFSGAKDYGAAAENENYYSAYSNEAILTPMIANLEDIKSLNVGDFVLVNGVVAVLPGVLGSQYFYIVSDGGAGIQIYSYKKDFPELKVGDFVEVTGELSRASGELRIKTKQKENIIILKHTGEPVAEEISCGEISEETAGSLIKISGEIVERKGSVIYLDDGGSEARVYLKSTTGLNPKNYAEGEIVEVAGIVGLTSTGARIMPRGVGDIIKKANAAGPDDKVEVLGASSEGEEWAIEARDKKLEFFKYLLVIAAAAIILLGALLTKAVISGKK